MIFLQFDEDGNEIFRHTRPFDEKMGMGKTEEELLEIGILVESIPEPEIIQGKNAVLKFDGENLYYEYVDIKPTTEEFVKSLRNDLDAAILELTLVIALQQGDE